MGGARTAQGREENAGLLAFLGFPEPPHRIRGSRPLWALRLGYGLLAAIFLVGLALLWLTFGAGGPGRSLVADTAYGFGLGSRLPEAQVSGGPCRYRPSRPGSRLAGDWECPVEVREAAGAAPARDTVSVAFSFWQEAPIEAGRVFGGSAVRWPPLMLLNRWLSLGPLLAIEIGLIWFAVAMYRGSGRLKRLSAVRRGRVRSADLLTWQDRPWFAFLDDGGTRRFAQAPDEMLPLILDGVRTTGAALVHGRDGVLLDAGLDPLLLPDAGRAAILSRASEVQQQCRIRRALPPAAGDPPDLAGRIARIEAGLKGKADLAGLYDEAWRLVWDADVQDIAERALAARDAIALKLGPEAAHAALDGCRRRHAGMA